MRCMLDFCLSLQWNSLPHSKRSLVQYSFKWSWIYNYPVGPSQLGPSQLRVCCAFYLFIKSEDFDISLNSILYQMFLYAAIFTCMSFMYKIVTIASSNKSFKVVSQLRMWEVKLYHSHIFLCLLTLFWTALEDLKVTKIKNTLAYAKICGNIDLINNGCSLR